MILPIDDTYRIAADAQCWSIQRRKQRKEGETWESFKFYTTLDDAVQGLAQLMIRTSDAQTLADALLEAESIATRLSLALSPTVE